jgi:hypothetical protein
LSSASTPGTGTAVSAGRSSRASRSGGTVSGPPVALDADGVRFPEQHGFERDGTLRLAVLDLRGAILPELPDSPVRVLPLTGVRDRPAGVYTLYLDTLRDARHAEQFLEQAAGERPTRVLDNPDLDAQIGTVVLDRGEPVAFARLSSDRRRAVADSAGTARSHRGRGLATLARIASSRAAQAAGLESIATENDIENAPLLASNSRLGFRAGDAFVQFAKAR